MKKLAVIIASAVMTALLVACGSSGVTKDDQAIEAGINRWNKGNPDGAKAYWEGIENSKEKAKWMGYLDSYNAGVKALDTVDSIKVSNEAKLLSTCNTVLDKFSKLDERLVVPEDVAERGADLSAGRIEKLLAAEKVSQANKMFSTSIKVYGEGFENLDNAGKQAVLAGTIVSKKSALNAKTEKALAIDDFDEKIKALDANIAAFKAGENEIASAVSSSEVGQSAGVQANVKSFKKARQDLIVQRSSLIKDAAYEYKDRIGEEFARQPEGTGSKKDGSFTLEEIRAHYKSVEANINTINDELGVFAAKYPKDIGKDIIDDITAQKVDLTKRIAQIDKEIAHEKEVASRGKTVMPLMIGLFNPVPGTSAADKKSRPAKFANNKQKGDDYWWGMVSIPASESNDIVITLKDNRTVRVFGENTHSGKDIEKKKMKNLVSMANKVGNSWPVLNAGKQLPTDKYFIEIKEGKTQSYSGEVVVYKSFITRMR